MNKEKCIDLLRSYYRENAKKYGLSRMALFGSVARGENLQDSDIDVAYEGKANLFTRIRMKRELEILLGCKVDIIRLRKQDSDSLFEENISKDLIYVG